MDPSGKKSIFVGYSKLSKAYKVYIPSYRQIETNKDVTFDKDAIFSISRQTHTNEVHDKEREAPRVVETGVDDNAILEEHVSEDHDMTEPQRPIDPPR